MRWWKKTVTPNMIEIKSANELVDTLKNSGDRLVIIDFYSPACGGCKALHPKICKLAESNPDAIFLKVNHEELKKMCHALHIHVLPFFRFYKGSNGRLCSFSCTVSTVKKFKEALAKHNTEVQTSLVGPSKGLDESELVELASIGEISTNPDRQIPLCIGEQEEMNNLMLRTIQNPNLVNITQELFEAKGDNSMLVA